MDSSFAFDHFGFRGSFLTSLMNFLKDGKYFVSVNSNSSDTKVSNNGVPQGSNLGPLFFLIYVNDMINCSNILKFILFADDTSIMYNNSKINEFNKILTKETNKVLNWFSANKLLRYSFPNHIVKMIYICQLYSHILIIAMSYGTLHILSF